MKNIIFITSTDNGLIKKIAALKNTKNRKEQGYFIAEGNRTCQTIIQTGLQPIYIFVTDKQSVDHWSNQHDMTPVIIVSEHVMKKISQATTPSGILCVFPIKKPAIPLTLGSGLVLVNIADPGNLGTLIRTAVAMNCHSVVLVDGTDPWSSKVVQSSAGYIAAINLYMFSWTQLIETKKKNNLNLIALVVHGGKKPEALSFTNGLLVIGNEAHGIPSDWITTCDMQITIPMPGETESLNAAIAGSIALYLAFGNR